MREYSVPADYLVPDDWSCAQAIEDWAHREPGHVLFRRKVGSDWTDVTASEFAATVHDVAKGLIASGIQAGDRVALLAATSYEWQVIDFAIWTCGAVTVPIYDSSSSDQVRWIMQDSASRLLIVDDESKARTCEEAIVGLEEILGLRVINGPKPALDTLSAEGSQVPDEALHERRRTVSADSAATLIYTSGTTGRPKGCVLTHRNFQSEALAILATPFSQYLRAGAFSVMFLPLAHVLARAVTYAGVYAGVTICHQSDVTNLVGTFGELRPHYILAVPRVFEKVFATAQATAQSGGRFKAAVFSRAVNTAIEFSKASQEGTVGPALRLRHALASKLVYDKLVAALGGRCEVAISGGAPLGERLGHFFNGIGVHIYEGYGLTETCAAHCVNVPGAMKIGTVGRPMPGMEVRIADDGEIEVHGPVVTTGYWKNPEATELAFAGGWFKTGDLGSLDEDGFLSITGRKKEIIVTAGGKNIAPNQLEDALRADPLIAEAVCVGDGKPFISVLLTVDSEAFDRWKQHHGKTGTLTELLDDPLLTEHMNAALAHANRSVSHAESIKKFRILPVEFTEENGELTPSMKIKRMVVHQKFAAEIEAFYAV